MALTNYRLLRSLLKHGHDVELVRPQPKSASFGETKLDNRQWCVPSWPLPFYPGLRIGRFCPSRLHQRWRIHRPDLVHIATEGPLGLSALLAARHLNIPVTSSFHTNFHNYCRHYGVPFLSSQALRYLRWFHNRCALTFVPTPDLLAELEGSGFLRLQLLGRGVDRELFHPERRSNNLRRQWGAGEKTPVVLCVGRVAREKNLPLVLEAFLQIQQSLPAARMVIVGDGPFLPTLRRRFPQACYTGMRLDEDLATHYASADLFFFASTTETFGNVVLEAMASGLAVLSYNYAAAAQHLHHLRSGMLVPFNQPLLFKHAALQLVSEAGRWAAMGAAARAATARVPWSSVTERFEQAIAVHAKACA